MAIEKLKINCKARNKTWTNQQIKTRNNGHERRLIIPQTQQRNPEHVYLNS